MLKSISWRKLASLVSSHWGQPQSWPANGWGIPKLPTSDQMAKIQKVKPNILQEENPWPLVQKSCSQPLCNSFVLPLNFLSRWFVLHKVIRHLMHVLSIQWQDWHFDTLRPRSISISPNETTPSECLSGSCQQQFQGSRSFGRIGN